MLQHKNAFHELQNEIDGIQDKLLDEVMAFIEENASQPVKSNL
jgi:alpha-beta hydrolase superfamily lysophospholipase